MKKLLLTFFVLFAVSFGNAQESIPPSDCDSLGGTWYVCDDSDEDEIRQLITSVCGEGVNPQLPLNFIKIDDCDPD